MGRSEMAAPPHVLAREGSGGPDDRNRQVKPPLFLGGGLV
jgi:hypothetical protein